MERSRYRINLETGKRLHPKGKRGATVTRLGTTAYDRAYDSDAHKRQERYPLDKRWASSGEVSPGLEREMALTEFTEFAEWTDSAGILSL